MNTTLEPTTHDYGNVTGHHKKWHIVEHESAIIFFIFCSCAVGVLVRRVIQNLNLRMPYTVVLLVLGVLFGLLSGQNRSIHEYASVVNIDPHLLLNIFLPVLIFESAFAMEVHTFMKTFVQVLLLAIPGLALASLFTCFLARYLFTYDWDWNTGMMFGAILSATDPVAVVALLRDLGASKKLAMVIEGESLLNDGAAIVFFQIFLKLSTSGAEIDAGEIIWEFVRVAVGGPLWGFLMAKITLFWLSRIFNDALTEITITLASTYITYYMGEVFLGVSGVLSVVVLGVAMNAQRTMISPEVEKFLHRFWETMAYIANTLIFIIVGMVISETAIFEIHGKDWFFMFALYFGIFVIRGMVIAIFSPILRHTGYGMSWQEGIIMTWGGLRGAVSLALALQVAHHDEIDQEKVGIRVLIHVSGIVFLTLLVNASTTGALLQILGMSDISPAKRMAMANSLRYLQDMRDRTLNMLKTDRFLADADWDTVEKSCELEDPYKTTEEEALVDESLDMRANAVCPDCDSQLPATYTRKELRDMTNEAVLRMLKAEKMSYWRQFEQGMLSREAVRKLQDCSDIAADKKGKSLDVEEIKKSWEVPSLYMKLKQSIKKFIIEDDTVCPKQSAMKLLYTTSNHRAFNITMYILILLDMVNLAFALLSQFHIYWTDKAFIFRVINVVFLSFYIIESLVVILVQKKQYLSNCWHNFCLSIIFIGTVDVVLSFVLPSVYGESDNLISIVLTVFICLRIVRIFRLLEPTMPLLMSLVKNVISHHLSYGYDVGRGYVAGEEEVRKLVDHMVDQKEISKNLKRVSDNGRLDVIRCLGMLQKQHPDIALSIKTRQAVRSVLNNLRDGIHELLSDGIIEETEGIKLEKLVEEKMKRLQSSPPSLPLPPPDRMLNNVFWLRNDHKLIVYIKEKAKLLTYNYEDIIITEGDPPGGIYIIVSGMVRLEKITSNNDQAVVNRPPQSIGQNLRKKYTHRSMLESTSQPGKPILDDHPSGSQLHIKSNLIDFLTAGNIIGEMGFLTKKPRSATVICETAVQLLFISLEDMEYALTHFNDSDPSLEYRLWHVCANRIATNVLLKQMSYQGWTKEKIKLRLENSYLLDADDIDVFTVDSSMSDVVLVNGFAQNAFTQEQIVGPAYIPWTVLKLELLPDKGPKPVLLIVPTEVGQPHHTQHKSSHDVRHGHGAFISSISQLCLNHASKHRKNAESKWKQDIARKRSIQKVQQAKSLGVLFNKGRINSDDKQHSATSNGTINRECYPLGARASTPGRIQTRPLRRFRRNGLENSESEDINEEHMYPIWTRSADSGQATCKSCGAEIENCICYEPENLQRTDELSKRRVSYHEPSWRYRKTNEPDDEITFNTQSSVRRSSTKPSDKYESKCIPSEHIESHGIHSVYHRDDTQPSESTTNFSTKNSLQCSGYARVGVNESGTHSPGTPHQDDLSNDHRNDRATFVGNSRLSHVSSGSEKASHRDSDTGSSSYLNSGIFDRRDPASRSGTDESGIAPLCFSSETHSMDTNSYDTHTSEDSRLASVSSGNGQSSMSTGTRESDSISSVTRETLSSRTMSSDSASVEISGSYSGPSGSYSSKSYSDSRSTTPSSLSMTAPQSSTSLCSRELNLESQEGVNQPDASLPPITDIEHITDKNKQVKALEHVVSGPSCPVSVSSEIPFLDSRKSDLDEDLASYILGKRDFALERKSSSLTSSYVPVMERIPEASGTDSVSTSVSNTSLNDDVGSLQAGCGPTPMEKIPEISGTDSVTNTSMDSDVNKSSITMDTKL
ncbi:sodium/hydrogen exchanger 10-like isoform X2 [Mizuhopecten yessoensis]|uniref:Sodium/hydrogen exchanger 10 n=1 Tax=Mizuhopecten yessoensis TaxID=6573 RepID=A0A210R3T1_MIZYE|nr:sodium/hydrogen exchanger 10-like isoform X2 [Mizuhopecten yessoensis]OWF55657.1 Sodium/hydrogen exchanger 10 [Mizuhopecten yessoensis]